MKKEQKKTDPKRQWENELERLKKENEYLSKKLASCISWMRRQIEEQVHVITRRKISKMTEVYKEEFLQENQEEIITKQIYEYFGEILLLNAPKDTIDRLVHSEISFFGLKKNKNSDGLTVIGTYQKILDACFENIIMNNFRKFAKKNGFTILRQNEHLEKALHLVVDRGYILSAGRLYGLLKSIRKGDPLMNYGQAFSMYLDKYPELRKLVLDENFVGLLGELIETDIMGSKRHSGTISFEETEKTRKVIVGNFKDKSSLLYLLLSSQAVMY